MLFFEVEDTDARAEGGEDVEQSRARGIEADGVENEAGAGEERRGAEEECGGREIAGDDGIDGVERLRTGDGDGAGFARERGTPKARGGPARCGHGYGLLRGWMWGRRFGEPRRGCSS